METIAKFPARLSGSLWGLTSFYNPSGYKNKLKNYRLFREASKKQGLKLLCVETAFGNTDFELQKADADILIQLRSKAVLWQKERLFNIGLRNLPQDCDKIAWLDADIIFCNQRWIEQTSELLQSYIVLQPFSFAIRLPKGVYNLDPNKVPFGSREGQKIHGMGYGIAHFGKEAFSEFLKHGHPGFAWAARRSIFDRHGFYDRLITGLADTLMGHAFYGNKNFHLRNFCSEKMIADQDRWMDRVYRDARGSVYYTKGMLSHLWHGQHKNRLYARGVLSILKKCDFDPRQDIKIDEKGLWAWATNKPKLHRWVKRYFWLRNEERAFSREIVSFSYRLARATSRFSKNNILKFVSRLSRWSELLEFLRKIRGLKNLYVRSKISKTTEKMLIVKGKAGMGNRIFALLAGIVYSRITKRRLIVDWSDSEYSQWGINVFHKLFTSPDVALALEMPQAKSIAPPAWRNNLYKSVDDLIRRFGLDYHNIPEFKKRCSIDLSRGDYLEQVLVMFDYRFDWKNLCGHLSGAPAQWQNLDMKSLLMRLLRNHLFLHPDIQRRVDGFKKKYFLGPVIGVHIRSTDNRDYPERIPYLKQYPHIIAKLLKRYPDARIFLSTDSRKILQSYLNQYKDIITTKKWYPAKQEEQLHHNRECLNRIQNAIEALIDMYLLAQCNFLVHSSRSSFSEISRLLSCIEDDCVFDVEDSRKEDSSRPDPFVSVVVPVFNDSRGLKTCLKALENQTYSNNLYEVIVVDNASNEDIEAVVSGFAQATLTRESSPTSYAARNKGISLAKGEVIAFTDSDCIPAPDWIAKGVGHLMAANHAGLVAGKIEVFFKEPARPTAVELYEKIKGFDQRRYIEQWRFGATANLFTLKSVFDQVGLFDPLLKSGGDRQWGERVIFAGYKQVYADDIYVAHPARYNFPQLYKRAVRIAGGDHHFQRMDSNSIKKFFKDLFPRVKYNLRIFTDGRLKGSREKIKFLFVMMFVEGVRAWEKVRLRLLR